MVSQWLTDYEQLDRLFLGTFPRLIVRGEGAYLYDDAGHELLDGTAHLGACQIGHARPEMADRIAAQIRELEFTSMEVGHINTRTIELAEKLAPLVPIADPVFVFGSTGSEANEAAFRIARLYHSLRGEGSRVKILARAGSYHGSTYGALSATGVPMLREPFAPLVPGFVRTSQPSPGRCGFCESECSLACAEDVGRAIVREGPNTVAAFVAEPVAIMQAVKVPHREYWSRVRDICDASGVLLILDEVVTGFGRTGTFFAAEHWELRPDIVTMAKGLTSGYAPLSIAAITREIDDLIAGKAVFNMTTYGGHPVGCAAAIANLEILEREDLVRRAAALETVLLQELRALDERIPAVVRVSVIGLLSSVEFRLPRDATAAADAVLRIRARCYEAGVIARGAAFEAASQGIGAMFMYPPLVVSEDAVRSAIATIGDALERELE
jgi:putrescine aminotransferase